VASETPYGFIYITTNMVNGMKYIGQKKLIHDRKDYLGSGQYFKRALRKYGKENFKRENIATAYSKEELNALEISYINKNDAVRSKKYYNIAEGGSGNPLAGFSEERMNAYKEKKRIEGLGRTHSVETKKRLSEMQKGEKGNNYGKHPSNETREKLRKATKGINNPFYGKKHTMESKLIMSQGKAGSKNSFYGKKHTTESKQKMRDNSKARRVVVCLNTKEIFKKGRLGAKKYKVDLSSIIKCCKEKVKSAGMHPETKEKLKWMYYEDYLKTQKVVS